MANISLISFQNINKDHVNYSPIIIDQYHLIDL